MAEMNAARKYQAGDSVVVIYPEDGSTEEVLVVRYADDEYVTIHHTWNQQGGYVHEFDTSVPEGWLNGR